MSNIAVRYGLSTHKTIFPYRTLAQKLYHLQNVSYEDLNKLKLFTNSFESVDQKEDEIKWLNEQVTNKSTFSVKPELIAYWKNAVFILTQAVRAFVKEAFAYQKDLIDKNIILIANSLII